MVGDRSNPLPPSAARAPWKSVSQGRVAELYAFDQKVRSSVASGLVPDVGLTAEDAKNAEGFRKDKIFLCDLSDLCGKTKGFPSIAGCDEAGRGALAGPVVVACVKIGVKLGSNLVFCVASLPDTEQASLSKCKKQDLTPNMEEVLDLLAGLDDSKRLSPKKREALFSRITSFAHWGIGCATSWEIDRLGIVPAAYLAARRAYHTMGRPVDLLLLDRGLSLRGTGVRSCFLHCDPEGITASHSDAMQKTRLDPEYLPELAFTKGDARSLHIAAASIIAKVARDRMMVELHTRFPGYGLDRHKGYGTKAHLEALRRLGPSPIHRRSFRVH